MMVVCYLPPGNTLDIGKRFRLWDKGKIGSISWT